MSNGKEKTIEFLKSAFIIDGECIEKGIEIAISKTGDQRQILTFEMHDSERGVFYVSLSPEQIIKEVSND